MRRFFLTLLISGLVCLAVTSQAPAASWLGFGAANDWDDGDNWDSAVPPASGELTIVRFSETSPTSEPIIAAGVAATTGPILLGDFNNSQPADGPFTLGMTGGTLDTAGDIQLGISGGSANFDLSGGTVTISLNFLIGHAGGSGQSTTGTVNQTGGTLNVGTVLVDFNSGGPNDAGIYNLNGGLLAVSALGMGPQGLMDITDGTMRLDGDQTGLIKFLVGNQGQITAFGGSGTVLSDYNVSNPGVTTVWAANTVPTDFEVLPSIPNPYGNQHTSLLGLTGGGVTIESNRVAGGALWSWTHNGKQYINTQDYGRLIQSAYFDPTYTDSNGGSWGLINPNEAGSRFSYSGDATLRQGSPLVEARNDGLTQITRSQPLEWSPQLFGGGASNPVLWSDVILGKNITLDYNGMGPVAKYETILVPPADSNNSELEIPTGYLNSEFNRFWTFDAVSTDLNEVSPGNTGSTSVRFSPSSGFGGVIIADAALTNAMGVYGVLSSEGGSVDYFSLLDFGSTTKWNAVYTGPVTGDFEYLFTTWIMTGTLAEVTGYMEALQASGELGAILITSPGNNGDFDDDGDVDGADFLAWQRGESPTPLSTSDLAEWETNYGATSGALSAGTSSVPEPTSAFLLGAGGMILVALRRGREMTGIGP